MQELKIRKGEEVTSVSAIAKAFLDFKTAYAWDKSLFTPRAVDTHASSLLQGQAALEDTSIEDFVRASQARAQQDRI